VSTSSRARCARCLAIAWFTGRTGACRAMTSLRSINRRVASTSGLLHAALNIRSIQIKASTIAPSGMHILKDTVKGIDHMDVIGWPENEFSLADNILRWNGSKDTRISTVIPVIAQHKILSWFEQHIVENVAAADLIGRERIDIGFVKDGIIDLYLGQRDSNGVAGETNDTLNILLAGIIRRVEDDDIATRWAAKPVRKLINQDIFASVKTWLHARTINPVGLNRH